MFTLKDAIFYFDNEKICLKCVTDFFILFAKFYIHKKKFGGFLPNFLYFFLQKIAKN
ncbi:hypothetical protein LDENG_00113980 [Lucifuga dentata]|nr:hypothetical protein LDENG_00113980 [Lucifuga dentata]